MFMVHVHKPDKRGKHKTRPQKLNFEVKESALSSTFHSFPQNNRIICVQQTFTRCTYLLCLPLEIYTNRI